jgi:hypothetical protein
VENSFADLNAFFTDAAVYSVNKSSDLFATPSAERAFIVPQSFFKAFHVDLLSREPRA